MLKIVDINIIHEITDCIEVAEICKGWSNDKKYHIVTANKEEYLLRVFDQNEYTHKHHEFQMMCEAYKKAIPMSRPISMGMLNDQTGYLLLTWCQGDDGEQRITQLTESKQYQLGVCAGQYLKKLQAITVCKPSESWGERYNMKIDRNLLAYQTCSQSYANEQCLFDVMQTHRHRLYERPQTFQHGDYHIGNMIISKDSKLQIIDFNRMDIGDPWEEFNRIVWSAQASPLFASGQIHGYFHNQVPDDFFVFLKLYICSNMLSSLPWAIPFGKQEILTMLDQYRVLCNWYDDMKCDVPKWYIQPL